MKNMLILAILFCAISVKSQVTQIGDDLFIMSDQNSEADGTHEAQFNPLIHENVNAGYDGSGSGYLWPFFNNLDNGVILQNYVDDLTGPTIKDYMGSNWTYEDHPGTDISLYSFREMDRFVAIRAAESGTVIAIAYDNYDRNSAPSGSANAVAISHGDGTYAYYIHLMKNSVTVNVGEIVTKGSLIGYAGSSGSSTNAHLHLETGYFVNGIWNSRDPWNGTYNTLPTLWENQYAYVGAREFKAFDMGVFTASTTGGSLSNLTPYLKEKILQPVSISNSEPKLGVWILVQGIASTKQVKFEIRKPNGTLFASTSFTITSNKQFSIYQWTPNFNVGISETGNWYARVLYDGVEQLKDYFNVQSSTVNRLRLYPAAGKCFRPASIQRDTLRVRPFTPNIQYELVNAPPNVTLTSDSILVINTFNQPYRVREFKVIASAGGSSSLRDTMIYKLIDPSKSNSPGNGFSLELNALMEGFWNGTSMVSDTVNVLLRSSAFPYGVIDSAKIKLNSNGYAVSNFLNASAGVNYYIVIKHRNSIETWSKTIEQFNFGYSLNYDFTITATKAYGNNMKYKSGRYCFYSGDVNQNGVIDLADVTQVFNTATALTPGGYENTDVNGDNYTDLDDILITYNNSSAFVMMIRP